MKVAVGFRRVAAGKRTSGRCPTQIASISKENQYVTNEVNIINEYPLYFITDKNNKVLMITDDVTKVMKKIFEFSEVDKNEIIDASNQYLKSQIQDMMGQPIIIMIIEQFL